MFSVTKTFTDYNGNEKTETYWFNLNKAELAKLALGPAGGLDVMLKEMINANEIGKAIDVFESIVLMAYGKKTPDGRFVKQDADGHNLSDDFKTSASYPDFLMDMVVDPDSMIAFINGCVPKELVDEVSEATAKAKQKLDANLHEVAISEA